MDIISELLGAGRSGRRPWGDRGVRAHSVQRGVGAQRVLPKLAVSEASQRGALWRPESCGCFVVGAGMWSVLQLEIESFGCGMSVTEDVNYSGISVIVMEVFYFSEGL